MPEWHVKIGDAEYTAADLGVLEAWVAERRVGADTEVRTGSHNWTRAQLVPGLREALGRLPPPAPPEQEAIATPRDGDAESAVAAPRPKKFCHACGQSIDGEAEICPSCGVRQPSSRTTHKKQKIVAALLALFLGGIGAHRFYLGTPGLAVLYILFVWTLIPAMVGFIEGIVILAASDEAFDSKYN